MASLSFACYDTAYAISTTGTVNRAFPAGSPALGNAAVVTHSSIITATLTVRNAFSTPRVPVDVIGLLGTNLKRGDLIGWTGYASGVVKFSQGLTAIADDWPLGKPRHVVAAIPRDGSGAPVWIDRFEFSVRFSGTRFFGRGWIGPAIKFQPVTDLGLSWSDSGAKVDHTIAGASSFVEMPVRRALTLACPNITQDDAFDRSQLSGGGGTLALLRSWRSIFEAGFLRRGSRMLLLPTEVDPYCSRLAEYCRLTNDVTLRHLQGPKLSLSLAVEED